MPGMAAGPSIGSAAIASGGTSSANASSRASPAVGMGGVPGSTISGKMAKKTQVNSNGYHPHAAHTPLSAMKSAALDLLSVERRDQASGKSLPKKKTRPHGLEDAPTYHPTDEEWRDPMEYMRKISKEARVYGICKIVPPESWNPDFAIDTERFHFRTRKQELNSVEGSTRANLSYLDALYKFHKQQGMNLTRVPYVDKKPLDLYRLKKAVEARGGFDKVCKHKKWAEIGRDLGYSGKIMSSLSTSLKNSYQKWLCPYEEYLRQAKPGIHQQLEAEYGGPFTPSPAPTPMKRSNVNTPSSMRADSPAVQASNVLQATINGLGKDGNREKGTSMADAPPSITSQPVTSGFRAINSGGFTAVNSGFTSVNKPPPPPAETKTPAGQKELGAPQASSTNTPEHRPLAPGIGPPGALLKRKMSCDSIDSSKKENGTDGDEGDNGNRRSKRLKKEAVPTVAGSHMTMFKPSVPRVPREDGEIPGEKCEQCGKTEIAGTLMMCESCEHAYHYGCLGPPPKSRSDAGWNCPRCLVGDGQFGFEEGGLYSLKQFQQKAADFKAGHFEKKMPIDPETGEPRPITEEDVEREFWRLVSDIEETVEVEYGADIHCTTHGSGFPTPERNPLNPYSFDPWNLTLLPLHSDSLFRHIKSDISGMTVPWVYVGMIFSTFCWHNEDHYSYSANYQHFGETKTWYGIPGDDAEKFEAAMKEAVPELFETQPDLLFQLVTLLPPDQLRKAGVRVYAIDQRAGELVVTFPQAYHAGFNHGFNFNEAVNFAPCDWEPYGLAGVERLQSFRRQPCFSHDELLWTAAEGTTSGVLTIQTAKWLAPALERINERERNQRGHFLSKHARYCSLDCKLGTVDEKRSCPMVFAVDDQDVPEEEYQCAYCKAYAFTSRFRCLKSGKVLCLSHAGDQQCCDSSEKDRLLGHQHMLIYRKDDETMRTAYEKVAEKARTPEAWEEKYNAYLDEEAVPSLKTLRALLHEGEKIPHDLPSLPQLREFVDRCNDWVEEATNYTARKQMNRRKQDKTRPVSGSLDDRDRDARHVSNIYRLLEDAEQLGFDSPEILQLSERADAIEVFQKEAQRALEHSQYQDSKAIEELLEKGQSFNVDLPEVDRLCRVLDQLRWNEKARELRTRKRFMTLHEVEKLLEDGTRLEIPPYNDHLTIFREQVVLGQQWEKKARELISVETINYAQLEALSAQVQQSALAVTEETLAKVDQILQKQREAHKQIIDLLQRSRSPDPRNRPKYCEVCDIIKKLDELNVKPQGTVDLEREQKRHEDWMRSGKKLFGKANAPLHILRIHLDYVLERNRDCFDTVNDKPRDPAEPASREPSPTAKQNRWEDPNFREVFCLCRRIEAGMMIECGICHEWYHGKCLKIARGKVKDDDKEAWTCPVCDHRVKIPRDAARPRLEDLVAWYDEIPMLPFQPEEEEVLKQIIDNAQGFRDHIAPYINSVLSSQAEAETQRFYLRKLEGAEVFLVSETNFFRLELHKWCHVANEPPPLAQESKSTRKPRPTKLQKLMAMHGVDDPDDLPVEVKGKANSLRRKAKSFYASREAIYGPPALKKAGDGVSPPESLRGGSISATGHSRPGTSSSTSQPPLSATPKVEPMDLDINIHPALRTASMSSAGAGGGRSIPGPGFYTTVLKLMDISDRTQGRRLILEKSQENTEQGRQIADLLYAVNVWGKAVAENQAETEVPPPGSLRNAFVLESLERLNARDEPARTFFVEVLGYTPEGRLAAEEFYGPDIFTKHVPTDVMLGGGEPEADAPVMMTDDGEKKDATVTAASLDDERNGMDALLDGE